MSKKNVATVLGQETNFTKLQAMVGSAVSLDLKASDLTIDENIQKGGTVVVVYSDGKKVAIRGDVHALKSAAAFGKEVKVTVITSKAFESLKVVPEAPKTGNGSNRIQDGWGI